jgi:hypothetical protein
VLVAVFHRDRLLSARLRLKNQQGFQARGEKFMTAGRRQQHTGRARYPENFASGVIRFPGSGRTRSKMRPASGFATA